MKLIEQLTIIAVALLSLTAIGGCVTLIIWIVEILSNHRRRSHDESRRSGIEGLSTSIFFREKIRKTSARRDGRHPSSHQNDIHERL